MRSGSRFVRAVPGYRLRPGLQSYLLDPGNVVSILSVMLAGYAAALLAWEIANPSILEAYVLGNELPLSARWILAAVLVLGMATAGAMWLAGTTSLARRYGVDRDQLLDRTARLSLVVAVLPFIPVLALPWPAGDWPPGEFAFTAALIVVMAGLVLAALWPVRAREPIVVEPRHETSVIRVPGLATAPSNLMPLALMLAMVAGYALFMSLLTVGRHNTFGTHAFDLGIYDQGLTTLLRHGYMRSTLFGEQAIAHSGEHFSPIFYLMAPLYAPAQSARTLLVLQSVFLAAGAIPVYLLALAKLRSTAAALALAAVYLLYPALHGVNNFDFHQIALVTPLLLCSLYFLETGRTGLFVIFLALAAFTKEEVALTCAAIGLYVWFGKRRPGLGAAVVLASLGYFITVTQVIMPALGGGAKVFRFDDMIAPGSDGFVGVLLTLFTNPFYSFAYALLDPAKVIFLVQLLLPLLFLPLLAPQGWIVAVPSLATSLLSSYPPQYSVSTHYAAIIIPPLFFLGVLGLARLHRHRLPLRAFAAALLVAGLASNYQYGWLFSRQFAGIPRPDEHDLRLAGVVAEVPPDASVSTLSDIVPHLSNRDEIFLFPVVAGADYILFDSAVDGNFYPLTSRDARSEAIATLIPYITEGEYGLVRSEDGIVLLKRGEEPSRNGQALLAALSGTWEAETLRTNLSERNEPDTTASAGLARVSTPDMIVPGAESVLTYGPYTTLPPGNYQVVFRLRHEGDGVEGTVATVEVFSNAAGGALAGSAVQSTLLDTPGQYRDVVVDLETHQPYTDLEFRVIPTGSGALWVDTIQVVPLRVALPALSYDLPMSLRTVGDCTTNDSMARELAEWHALWRVRAVVEDHRSLAAS